MHRVKYAGSSRTRVKGTKARTGTVTMKVRTRNRDINIAYDPQCNYEDRSKRTRRLRYSNIYYSKLLNPSFLYFYLHCLYLSVRIPASFPFGLVEDNLASSLVRFSDTNTVHGWLLVI